MPLIQLITKAQWDKYKPYEQGYLVYLQGSLSGSELKNLGCPYPVGSKEAREFGAGEFNAMLSAQDEEE